MAAIYLKVLCTAFLVFIIKLTNGLEVLTPSQSMRDGETLVSPDGTFELGFFSPAAGISNNTYLGIWYKLIPVRTVVWVANRVRPINDSSGVLMVDSQANLLLLSQNNTVVWSANSTIRIRAQIINPVVQLLDTANLVVVGDQKDVHSGNYLWQSFDYPTDTLLPGMKLGWDLTRGLNWSLTSWKSKNDPSPGDFVWGIAFQNFPEGVMWMGSEKYYRSGPWNGVGFSGAPELRPNRVAAFSFVSTGTQAYFTYTNKDVSIISRMFMNQTSTNREVHAWSEASQAWVLTAAVPRDRCDSYAVCGPHGNCLVNDFPLCQCLNKFKPKSPDRWNSQDWTQGCERNKPLDCPNDGFIKFEGLKLPDATYSWVNETMNLDECRVKCLQNCNCTAYTKSDISRFGGGCAIWFGDLTDIREFSAGGQDLYIRMHGSEIASSTKRKSKIPVIIAAVIGSVFGLALLGYYIWRTKSKRRKEHEKQDGVENNDEQKEDMELPLLEFAALSSATDNFSFNNKLGEGGFGPVYRGTLKDGQEIAVKMLSKTSGQGLDEFKNEVILIRKLQHRNLVKLLSCCIHEQERMLVYEYMPNNSLDRFLFDKTRSKLLDWPKRFNIIGGIARGLLYLHQDSRLRIIHRDLKASNILLDRELNPKISDFGLARSFGGDQTEGNTRRVVGTYGYMAPEYATDGLFSVKSDVFSFGILLLEIISGEKSRGFYHPDHSLSLIGHAWRLWKEGKPFALIDPSSENSSYLSEVLRCINIGLLCVQQHPGDRPNMASVVWMLGGDSVLPQPKEPGYFKDRGPVDRSSSSSKMESCSINEMTNSILDPR